MPMPTSLEAHGEAPALRVLSWNVGQTIQTKKLRKNLESNIKAVIESPGAPEILLFIEANSATIKALENVRFKDHGYDQMLVVPYSDRNPWAYFVLVWKSTELTFKRHLVKPLNFDLQSKNENEQKRYEAMREYIGSKLSNLEDVSLHNFDFEFYGKSFSLYPVPLSNVWPFIESYVSPSALEKTQSWALPEWAEKKQAEILSKAIVLKSLVTENANPHSVSLKDLIQKINSEHPVMSEVQKDDSVLVVGDFNAFPRIDTIHGMVAEQVFESDKSHACAEMEKHFSPLYVPAPHYSFPSESYREAVPNSNFKLLIDLAYTRGALFKGGTAEILPLSGSDHYPVYYRILLQP